MCAVCAVLVVWLLDFTTSPAPCPFTPFHTLVQSVIEDGSLTSSDRNRNLNNFLGQLFEVTPHRNSRSTRLTKMLFTPFYPLYPLLPPLPPLCALGFLLLLCYPLASNNNVRLSPCNRLLSPIRPFCMRLMMLDLDTVCRKGQDVVERKLSVPVC